MDQFIMAGLIGAIVVIVCYTTIQVMDIIDNRKHKTVYGLTPGRLYERPNNPPPPPIKLSADETLKRLVVNENLKRLQKVSNLSGLTIDNVAERLDDDLSDDAYAMCEEMFTAVEQCKADMVEAIEDIVERMEVKDAKA